MVYEWEIERIFWEFSGNLAVSFIREKSLNQQKLERNSIHEIKSFEDRLIVFEFLDKRRLDIVSDGAEGTFVGSGTAFGEDELEGQWVKKVGYPGEVTGLWSTGWSLQQSHVLVKIHLNKFLKFFIWLLKTICIFDPHCEWLLDTVQKKAKDKYVYFTTFFPFLHACEPARTWFHFYKDSYNPLNFYF